MGCDVCFLWAAALPPTVSTVLEDDSPLEQHVMPWRTFPKRVRLIEHIRSATHARYDRYWRRLANLTVSPTDG